MSDGENYERSGSSCISMTSTLAALYSSLIYSADSRVGHFGLSLVSSHVVSTDHQTCLV